MVANKHVANVNMAYECILGESSFDMPSAVGIDLDNKNPAHFSRLPSLEYTWDVEKFVDWILPEFLAALNELCPTLDPPLSERDLWVGDSSKPFRAENVQDYEQSGRPISLHVKVDRIMFAGQSDRSAFAQFLSQRLPHLADFIDANVYSRNRNMRILGSQKFNKQPLMPYVRDRRYKDQTEYAHWSDIPATTIAEHCWSLPAAHCTRLFSDDTVGLYLKGRKSSSGNGTRRVKPPVVTAGSETAETAEDPRVSVVLAIYGQYARTHGIPFEVGAATYKVTTLDDGDYEVYVQHKAGTVRTCPLGRVHDSNNYKLVVRGDSVFYFCFSAAPTGCGTVQKCTDVGCTPVILPACRTAGRLYCCDVYVGDLPFQMFEVPTDWERAPRKDRNGVLREDEVTLQVEAMMKDIVAKAAGCQGPALCLCTVVRSSYGSGKTLVWVSELITTVLLRNPTARIAYVANSIARLSLARLWLRSPIIVIK
jgi:hypothetical protein